MWIAERLAVRPDTDETAAMAYRKSDHFEEKHEAKAALLAMIEGEIASWQRMGAESSLRRDQQALEQLQDDAVDSVVVGAVRWRIREWPASPKAAEH
ncbi:hypothetical protein [Microbispora sp. NPDC049125]|uniref:hypothetical protein n=1 Tax=Microbispora sp. NPDC049125 TaxID=3154929 RepID=UPI003465E4BF